MRVSSCGLRRWPLLVACLGCLLMSPAKAEDALINSILKGNHRQAAALLATGANANARQPDGSLPLAWAVEQQDAELVRLLLDHGARIDDYVPSGNAFRPLVVACLYASDAVLEQLLQQPINVNVRGPEAIPALSLCAAHASAKMVDRLLAAGARVDAIDDNGQTALMWAAAHGRIEAFDRLLAAGAAIDQRSVGGLTPLMFAIKSGDAEIASHVLAAGADPTLMATDGTTLLQLALYQHNFAFAEELVDATSDLTAFDRIGRQPLHVAAQAGELKLVKSFLSLGAPINSRTTNSRVPWRYEANFKAGTYEFPKLTAALLAAQQGHDQVLRLLAEQGADTAMAGDADETLLHFAAASGSPATLAAALELTQAVNAQNARGQTPLHKVLNSAQGSVLDAMLALLAKRAARTDIPDARGKTAAQLASAPHFKGRELFLAHFGRRETASR